jgi:hypothetical protein
MRRPLLLLVPFVLAGAACGGSDSGVTQLASTLPPTACASGTFESGRTITISVDDVVDGFGGLSSRTPSDLAAGTVRLSIEADSENEQPVTVTLSRDGSEITVVRGVPAGAVCAVDVDLQPGHYVAAEGDRDVEFDIVALS